MKSSDTQARGDRSSANFEQGHNAHFGRKLIGDDIKSLTLHRKRAWGLLAGMPRFSITFRSPWFSTLSSSALLLRHATPKQTPVVMRVCFPISRIPDLRSRLSRILKESPRSVSQRSFAKQLSNAELLSFIHQEREDAASAQTSSDGLDLHRNESPKSQKSVPASLISRLAQSPWTDPSLVAARMRHKAVKSLPSRDRSPFQLKLQKNPYGTQALISGLKRRAKRYCSQCTSDSSSTVCLDTSSTAELLPYSVWYRHTPENWGTMASSKASNPGAVQSCQR